ncbi:MAG: molecular chaperone HtpG, partial [Bacteroidales bacterium]|nr:molecular chaperone HtpG [Bacteroidales bacterium]
KDDRKEVALDADEQSDLRTIFSSTTKDGASYWVSFEDMGETASPVVITQSEFMRRMKDMAALSPTGGMYGGMPDAYNMVVNASHPLVKAVMEAKNTAIGQQLAKNAAATAPLKAKVDELQKALKDDAPQADRDALEQARKQLAEHEAARRDMLTGFAGDQQLVKQLVDLALLANNMLKGEDLSRFVKRSIELIKHG